MQGHLGKPLNKIGLEQSKKLGLRLKDTKIDVAYISDLSRAVETAAEVLAYHPSLKPIYSQEIRERSYGIYEAKHRDIYLAAAKKANVSYNQFKPEGGESVVEARKRSLHFFHKICEKHHHETVLVVSHGGFIRAFVSAILNEPLETGKYCNYRQLNTAVSIIDVNYNNCVVDIFNSVDHLG